MCPDLPPGVVYCGDRWVRSVPVSPGHSIKVVIAGRLDTALQFDDGSFEICDYKTSEAKEGHIPLYGRQPHAYALATENPAPGQLALSPVRRLGLLCVEPIGMEESGNDYAYRASPCWLDVPRDDESFFGFLSDVLDVLERTSPPAPSPDRTWCSYMGRLQSA